MKRLISLVAVGFVFFLLTTPLFGADVAKGQPSWQYRNIVDAAYVGQFATIPRKHGVVIVDSRPARKYDKGHIVPAINISNSQFDKMIHLLPEDKTTQLIFYCGGLKCPLSHKSAAKAEALGYTEVKVYAAGYPDWLKAGNIRGVSTHYIKKKIDRKADMMIVDARPARKFKKGHVPTSVNIPWRQFDEMVEKLPVDKGTELIYYCGGYKCPLSPKSARKAVGLGYTKVRLFQAGYPAWKQAYGAEAAKAAATPVAPKVETGEEEGIITIASFTNLLANHTDDFYWYDVRDPEEVEVDGTYGKAVVMSVDDVEDKMEELPSDKPIVFFCSTGARAGEAYDLVKMKREDLKVYFLDANVAFNKDGSMPKMSPPD